MLLHKFLHPPRLSSLTNTPFVSRLADISRFSSTTANENASGGEQPSLPPKRRLSISNGIQRLLLRLRLTQDIDTARFMAHSAVYSLYGLAGISLLGTLGIDTSPLLAGIGVTGLTVGFAVKEIATNFLSGVLLVFAKPFRKGQHLRVLLGGNEGRLEGEVVSIDARYVLLKTATTGGRAGTTDLRPAVLMVPSVVVYTNPIIVSDFPLSSKSSK